MKLIFFANMTIDKFLLLSLWLLRIKETLAQENDDLIYLDKNEQANYLLDSLRQFSNQNYKNKHSRRQNSNFELKTPLKQNEDGVLNYEESWDNFNFRIEDFNKCNDENAGQISNVSPLPLNGDKKYIFNVYEQDSNQNNEDQYLFEPVKSQSDCERVIKKTDPPSKRQVPLDIKTIIPNKPLEEQVSEMLTIFYGKDGKNNASKKDDHLFIETLLRLMAIVLQNEIKIYG